MEKAKNFMRSDGFKKYSTNFSWLFGARTFISLVSFLSTALVIRYLGPVDYGTLTFVISIASIFSFIADVGLEKITAREFILNTIDPRKIFGTSLIIRFIGSLIAFSASAIIAFSTVADPTIRVLIICSAMSLILSPISIINSYFQSKSLSKYPSILAMILVFTLAISKVVFVLIGISLPAFVLLTVIEPILYSIGYIWIYMKYAVDERMPWIFDLSLAKTLIKESWYLMFVTAFSIIFIRIDQIILQGMLGAKAVGLYDAGVRIAESWHFLPLIITTALFPAILGSISVGQDFFERRLKNLYRLMYIISTCIIIPLALLSPWLVHILYGSAYRETAVIIQIYAWAGLFIALSTVMQQHLISVKKSKYLLISTSIGAITNIALNFVLIPHYGIAGAAYATLISYALVPISLLIPTQTRREASLMLICLTR